MIKKDKILLIGGMGYIGKKFIEDKSEKFNLIVITKHKLNNSIKEKIQIKYCSITDKNIIQTIIKIKPDIILHLASITGLKRCEDNPNETFNVNVFGTLNVIEGWINTHSKLLFLSSKEVFGNNKNVENNKLDPINVYGKTKKKSEELIEEASKKYNLDYCILRLTNVFGPGGNTGLNKIIKDAVEKKIINVNDGNQIINPLYIDDIVNFIELIISNDYFNREKINVCSNEVLTLKTFVSEVMKHVQNVDLVLNKKPYYESDICFTEFEIAKKYGFSPKKRIEKGIINTVEFFEKNKDSIEIKKEF
jgi:nucleoside-diphosphate-sugar epimerase